ncbi:hypothetical protein [Streptomyces sp. NBC_00467]|uniref:hypothetical protein n=1 Tax=Streptomyces sp. NBC_00467 TaxID=2975752 RepID=UPI002E194E77
MEAANPAFFAAIGGSERVRTGLPVGELMPELAEKAALVLTATSAVDPTTTA